MRTSGITYYPSLPVKDNAKKNGVTDKPFVSIDRKLPKDNHI